MFTSITTIIMMIIIISSSPIRISCITIIIMTAKRLPAGTLEQHKSGRIKPARIKRAALSLQHQDSYTFDVRRVKHPGTKQLPIHISGAGFEANLQIWLLGTTPFDTTPFTCLRGPHGTPAHGAPAPGSQAHGPCTYIYSTYSYDYTCIYIYIYTYMCIYMYIYRERESCILCIISPP